MNGLFQLNIMDLIRIGHFTLHIRIDILYTQCACCVEGVISCQATYSIRGGWLSGLVNAIQCSLSRDALSIVYSSRQATPRFVVT